MDLFEAILLGILQGITEYLPVSSSGHLELGKHFMGVDHQVGGGHYGVTFNVILHLATVFSTWVIFRKEINTILLGLFDKENKEARSFSFYVIISMIPAGVIGFLFEDHIDQYFSGNIPLIGWMLIFTGGLLLLTAMAKKTDKKLSPLSACIIGLAQAIALLPGISRSGATISTSVLLGIDKETAAQFSFIMVMPLIVGKVLKDLISGDMNMGTEVLLPMSFGFIAAFITGVLACQIMLAIVKQGKLAYFSLYCLGVGLMAIVLA